MRICIDLRKDANANVVLNQLYKHTQLQDTFGVIMLCVVPKGGSLEPKVLNLKQLLEALSGTSGGCCYQKDQSMI